MALWLPDGLSVRVEWYVSNGRATGVQSIADDWIPRDVPFRKPAGFERIDPYDPERDEWVDRDGAR